MSGTHYTVLGVSPNASADVIRRAYREAVRRTHPDVARSTSTTASDMARITEAWAVLSDPSRRAAYDASLRNGTNQTTSAPPTTEYVLRHPPARFPWRLVGAIIAGGIIVILVLNALAQPSIEVGPDGLLDRPRWHQTLRVTLVADLTATARRRPFPSPDDHGWIRCRSDMSCRSQ